MKIVKSLSKDCGASWDCPEVSLLENGRLAITGWIDDTETTETTVIVPATLLTKLGATWT